MKVGEVSGKEPQVQGVRDSGEKVAEGGEDFKKYLNESSRLEGNGGPVPTPAGGVETAAVNPVLAANGASGNSGPSAVGEKMAAAVGQVGQKLDQMAAVLDSGATSLKDLGHAVGTLSEQADSLQQTVKDLPGDHPLRKFGDELNVLAYTESVKWQRGDYV